MEGQILREVKNTGGIGTVGVSKRASDFRRICFMAPIGGLEDQRTGGFGWSKDWRIREMGD